MTVWIPRPLITAGLAVIISIAFMTSVRSDPLDDFVAKNLTSSKIYSKDISEYLEKHRTRQTITADDRLRYSDAYAYSAYVYFRRNNTAKAYRSVSEALKLDPNNPNVLFIAGFLSEKRGDYANAVKYLQNASELGDKPVKRIADDQLDTIASALIKQATQLAENRRFVDANKYLVFVAEQFADPHREVALKHYNRYRDEVAAQRMLAQAQHYLMIHDLRNARNVLKELTTNYSWTYAAEQAQKIMRKSDDPFVRAKSDSKFGEVAAKEKWKVMETENFTIYYQNNDFAKEAARIIESVFAKVLKELNFRNFRWRGSNCKVFLFDDDKKWKEFKQTTGAVSEWAAAFAVSNSREIFGNASQGTSLLYETLPHELTHVIHGEYLDGVERAPLWLKEGLAVHHQFNNKSYYYLVVQRAINSGNDITLEELTEYQKYPSEKEIDFFYAASLTLVEFIIEKYGIDEFAKLNRYTKNSGRGINFKTLCSRFMDAKPDVVEKMWKQFVTDKVKSFSNREQ